MAIALVESGWASARKMCEALFRRMKREEGWVSGSR
jgi:hypothetical protein